MAIKKNLATPFGIQVNDAYHRVVGITLERPYKASFAVNAYATGAPHEAPLASKTYSFVYDLHGFNIVAQAYEHLKTHKDFEGGVDC
jgi:hypothetical protein